MPARKRSAGGAVRASPAEVLAERTNDAHSYDRYEKRRGEIESMLLALRAETTPGKHTCPSCDPGRGHNFHGDLHDRISRLEAELKVALTKKGKRRIRIATRYETDTGRMATERESVTTDDVGRCWFECIACGAEHHLEVS